ncbi:MAG: acyl-CoA thioesterase [Roseiflexaceae bacterium]
MNRLFRLLWTLVAARFRSRVAMLGPCRTSFWVWPNDLDLLWHMNNGSYFSLLDLARIDLMIRAGIFDQLNQRGWYPVVASETMLFRRSLKLFERFEVVTEVAGWDEQAILLTQRFERGGQFIGLALIRARFLKRSGGSVTPGELLGLANLSLESPPMPEWIARWNADQVALHRSEQG